MSLRKPNFHANFTVLLLTEASIQKLIEDELAKYDADKLGIPDYALESSGKMALHMSITKRLILLPLCNECEILYLNGCFIFPSGGSIVATPDTRNYKQMTWVTLWGIRLFKTGTNSPRNIIQVGVKFQKLSWTRD